MAQRLTTLLSSDIVNDIVATVYGVANGYLLDKRADLFLLVNLIAVIASIAIEDIPDSVKYAAENNIGIVIYAMISSRSGGG